MIAFLRKCCVLPALLLAPLAANAEPHILSEKAWREDIEEMVATVKASHPNPYRNISEGKFDNAVAALQSRLRELSDKEIIVEMAKIIALIGDGHTRLSIPRQHDELSFSFSHSVPKKPKFKKLAFSSLPFQFQVMEGALYITKATQEYAHFVGAKVLSFDNTSTDNALKSLSQVNYNDNNMTNMLLAADRAALPDILKALHITNSAAVIHMTVKRFRSGKEETIRIMPLTGDPEALYGPDLPVSPLWLADITTSKWTKALTKENAHYIKLNKIEADLHGTTLADFMREALSAASKRQAGKVIIDLRHNHGGSNGGSRAVINAIVQSPYNKFGGTLVLIGRETFSAAGNLVNQLEQYTDALFFGEGTGAAPDSYGDPIHMQLHNSGLELRVSRLHWSAWRAFETRSSNEPHYPIVYTIDDYMGGRDPVLETALAYKPPQKLSALISEVFANNNNWDGGVILLTRYATDSRVLSRDHSLLASELLIEGLERENNGEALPALMLFITARELDDNILDAYLGIARLALLSGDKDRAKRAVIAGLAKFPESSELKGLAVAIKD